MELYTFRCVVLALTVISSGLLFTPLMYDMGEHLGYDTEERAVFALGGGFFTATELAGNMRIADVIIPDANASVAEQKPENELNNMLSLIEFLEVHPTGSATPYFIDVLVGSGRVGDPHLLMGLVGTGSFLTEDDYQHIRKLFVGHARLGEWLMEHRVYNKLPCVSPLRSLFRGLQNEQRIGEPPYDAVAAQVGLKAIVSRAFARKEKVRITQPIGRLPRNPDDRWYAITAQLGCLPVASPERTCMMSSYARWQHLFAPRGTDYGEDGFCFPGFLPRSTRFCVSSHYIRCSTRTIRHAILTIIFATRQNCGARFSSLRLSVRLSDY